MVATDRISAFDVVLPTGIPDKGLVLNRMSAFWFEQTQHLGPNHFIALADAAEAAPMIETSDSLSPLPPAVAKQTMVVKRPNASTLNVSSAATSQDPRGPSTSGKGRYRANPCPQVSWRAKLSRSLFSPRLPKLKKVTTRTCQTRKWSTWWEQN